MIKHKIKLSLMVLCAAAIWGLPAQIRADGTAQSSVEQNETRPKKPGTVPFHGKLKSVDQAAKTIAVGDLVIQITSETKISRDGKPAVLADGGVGDKVSGAYKKTAEGKLDATTIKFGEVEKEKEKAKKDVSKKEM